MRARFIGDPRDNWGGPELLPWLGVTFRKGEWIEVSDEVAGRLSGHSHFEVEAADEAIPPDADPITDWRTLDKAALDAYAAALGVKLDRRRSLENMQADFEAALNAGG